MNPNKEPKRHSPGSPWRTGPNCATKRAARSYEEYVRRGTTTDKQTAAEQAALERV